MIPGGQGKGPGADKPGPYTKPGEAGEGGGDPDEGRMIYVGKVPFSANWQKLKDHMKQAGEVEFVQILSNEYGKSRGVGFVRYSTAEMAQAAIATLNGTTMEGTDHPLEVDVWTGAKPRTQKGAPGPMMMKGFGGFGGKCGMWTPMFWAGGGGKFGGMGKGGKGGGVQHDKSLKVWVGSLPQGAKWQELKEHFNQAGTVEFCNVRGSSGEVRFATAEQAQQAINTLNGSEFGGAALVVDKWT